MAIAAAVGCTTDGNALFAGIDRRRGPTAEEGDGLEGFEG